MKKNKLKFVIPTQIAMAKNSIIRHISIDVVPSNPSINGTIIFESGMKVQFSQPFGIKVKE